MRVKDAVVDGVYERGTSGALLRLLWVNKNHGMCGLVSLRSGLRFDVNVDDLDPRCEGCHASEGLELACDVYSVEIRGDDTKRWLCGGCRARRAEEV